MMSTIELSKRLRMVSNYIPNTTNKFADIGTDHAYLPCYICSVNPKICAIAGEVNQGPFDAAVKQVEKYQLQQRIEVRLGNGLEVINPGEVDCITIAGMGGPLISTILQEGKGKLSGVERLVLQPNIHAISIREFAVENQFKIVAEQIFQEDGYIYELLVLEPSEKPISLTEKELYLGPLLLESKVEAFKEKWTKVYEKKKRIIDQMKQSKEVDQDKLNLFQKQIKWLEEELF